MDESQVDMVLAEIERSFIAYLHSNPENVDNAANTLVADLIDDAILGVVFEVDIQRKTKIDDLITGEPLEDKDCIIVDAPDKDIFGLTPGKKTYECICPECKRSLAASRFAPHLEKCMGMGRNSSRVASLRIANNASKDTYTSGTAGGSNSGSGSGGAGVTGSGATTSSWTDDEDDADWTAATEKRGGGSGSSGGGGKKKKDGKLGMVKKSGKYPKVHHKNESSSCSITGISYEAMSARDRNALLSQICGVMIENATKICTKSLKCSVHSDEQRRSLREELTPSDAINLEGLQVIDVDSVEEGEVVFDHVRGDIETPCVSSPASTSSSSSKSKSKSGAKSKNSKLSTPPKSHRNSPASASTDCFD